MPLFLSSGSSIISVLLFMQIFTENAKFQKFLHEEVFVFGLLRLVVLTYHEVLLLGFKTTSFRKLLGVASYRHSNKVTSQL